MNKKFKSRDLGFVALILAIVLITVFALTGMEKPPQLSSADVRQLIEDELVETVVVKDGLLTMELKEPWNGQNTVTVKLFSSELFYLEFNELLASQERSGILADYDYQQSSTAPWWASLCHFQESLPAF